MKYWLKAFPADQLLLIRLEDWGQNRLNVLNTQIYPFLGLPPIKEDRIPEMKAKNKNSQFVDVKMRNDTKRLLDDFHRPFNEDLAKIMNDSIFLWNDV